MDETTMVPRYFCVYYVHVSPFPQKDQAAGTCNTHDLVSARPSLISVAKLKFSAWAFGRFLSSN